MINFRIDNKLDNIKKICDMLPGQMSKALRYLIDLGWDERPDYQIIRHWLAEDINIGESAGIKIVIRNWTLAKDIMYDISDLKSD